jgi:hypothetical protein
MRSHVHGDIIWALMTVAVVVVGVKGGQTLAAYLGRQQGAVGSFGRALGGAMNLGVH